MCFLEPGSKDAEIEAPSRGLTWQILDPQVGSQISHRKAGEQ